MKVFILTALLILSTNTFGAAIEDCKVDNTVVQNVVVLNGTGISSIADIVNSNKSADVKNNLIKKILYIETVSNGAGSSVCELAVKKYNVTEEKCLKVMKSSDLIATILEESTPDETTTLECKIGVTAKLLMSFNM